MTDHTRNRTADNRPPEEIEHDLDRTRAQVSSTIDEIQSRLTPGQMMDQAFQYARTSLPADFGANLGNAVRDNPVPVALVSVGLAWLMMSGRQSDGHARARRQLYSSRDLAGRNAAADYDELYGASYATGMDTEGAQEGKMHRAAAAMSEKGSDLKNRASETGRGLMGKASDLKHKISDTASSMTGRAKDMTHQARDKMQGSGGNARSRASELGQRSQQQYYRAKSNFSHMLEEQPLMLGVLGIAVGTLLGAALPSTRREDQMMGRTRDNMLEKAKETASQQAGRVKESAKRVADVAKDEAKSVASDTSSSVRGKSDGQDSTAGSAGSVADSSKTEGMPGQHGYH